MRLSLSKVDNESARVIIVSIHSLSLPILGNSLVSARHTQHFVAFETTCVNFLLHFFVDYSSISFVNKIPLRVTITTFGPICCVYLENASPAIPALQALHVRSKGLRFVGLSRANLILHKFKFTRLTIHFLFSGQILISWFKFVVFNLELNSVEGRIRGYVADEFRTHHIVQTIIICLF